tara:strand:+ start:9914 stop:19087 length:9174 start_codon:yes stop_codon:yes gene_type:complete
MGKFYSTDSSSSILDTPLELEAYEPSGNSLDEQGQSLWESLDGPLEFVGQAAWGATEALTLGAATIADVAKEEIAKNKVKDGTLESSELEGSTRFLEKKVTSFGGRVDDSAEAFGDLSLWGQTGYTLGSILGTIPTFMFGGALTSKAITGVSKIGQVGQKVVASKVSKEIKDAYSKKIATNAVDDLAKIPFSDNNARAIAEAGMEELGKDGVSAAFREYGNEAFEVAAKGQINKDINAIVNLPREQAGRLSDEVFNIITRNNPNDAQRILFGLGAKAFPNSPKLGLVSGAMGYDAILGLTIGAMRGAAVESVKAKLQYDTPDMVEETYVDRILGETLHESAVLSVIGPVKFIRGGSQASMLKKTKEAIYGVAKNLTPAKKMSGPQLEATVEMMNQIAGTEITKKIAPKVMKKFTGHRSETDWWRNKGNSEAGRKELTEWINTARKDFVMNAPGLWLREFGAEMAYSLPRMAMGSLAMNASGIYEVVKHHGVENIEMAFGESPEERISNIFTAMYFTRKPHSFYTGEKMIGFETGEIRNYASIKGEMLNKTVGSLRAISSVDIDALNNYTGGAAKNYVDEGFTNHVVENSKELTTIRNLSSEHTKSVKARTGNEEVSAFNKAASKYNIENFGNDPTRLESFRKEILRTSAILEYYREASFSKDALLFKTFTKDEAGKIVNDISRLEFGGKTIDLADPFKSLNEWHNENIMNSTTDPLNNIYQFVKSSTSDIIGSGVPEKNGVMDLPRMPKLSLDVDGKSGANAVHAYNSAVSSLEKIGKVRITSEVKSGMDVTTEEVRRRVINNHEELNSSLHKWVYGDEFNKSNDNRYDVDIASNYSWYEPFLKIRENDQIKSAISVLKGTQDGSIKDSDRKRLIQEIDAVISGKSKIELEETKGSNIDPAEFQATVEFTKNLHKYYTDINKRGADESKIVYNDAAALKANVEEVLGSVFTNYNSKGRLSTGLLDATLKGVDFSNIDTPHNMKMAFRDLLHSKTFSETGDVIVPDITTFRNRISALETTNKISQDEASKMREFYTNLINIVENTTPNGITVRQGMSEGGGSKWYDEIKQIETSASLHYYNSSRDRIIKVVGGLENAQSKVNLLRLEKKVLLNKELDRKDNAKIIAEIKDSIKSYDDSVRDIDDMVFNIKASHQGMNRHLLHAVVKHESKMSDIIEQINQVSVDGKGRIFEHFKELSLEMAKINEYAIENGLKESSVIDRVNAEIAGIHVPERDVPTEITRTTISQFALKYGLNQDNIIDLTSLDKTRRKRGADIKARFENMQSDIPNLTDAARKKLKDLIDNIPNEDLATENFRKGIVEPLFRMTLESARSKEMRTKKKFRIEDIYSDLNTVITAATSSRPIIEYKYSAGRLIADTKLIGNAKDQERGVSGVIDYLSPGREDVVLLSNTNHSRSGKVVNNFPEYFKAELKESLNGSQAMSVDSKNALRDALFNDGAPAEIRERGKFRMIELDESTVVLARVDGQSLRDKIRYQFGEKGNLRERIDALGIEGNHLLKDFMDIVTNPSRDITDLHIENAVKITRALLDAPHIFQKKTAGFLGDKLESYEPEAMNKLWKYLKMAEPKNGYIGTSENLARSNAQLEFLKDYAGKGSHYDHLYTRAKEWVTPDAKGEYKPLKVLSISDETDFGEGFRNIFSSRGRAEAILNERLSKGEITKEQLDYNLELIESMKKSVADGEFIMAESPYIAHLAMQGSGGKDYIRFKKNGDVKEIRAGGIKPSITYSKVNTDKNSKNYGRARVFYAKTAFKHRPEFEPLLKDLGVDAITFKSANKINQYKKNKKSSWLNDDIDKLDSNGGQVEQTTYANVRRINEGSGDLGKNLVEWLSEPGNIVYHNGDKNNHITHLPLSSINMFSVGINHKPMVASSLGVHMQHDNGITEWINLRGRLDQTTEVFNMKRNNSLYTSALARKIIAGSEKVGDMAFANSGLDQVIKHNGLITDEWMQRSIDERTISYLLNGGAIAGAKVEHGSYDVMSGDFSGIGQSNNNRLAIPVREKLKTKDDVLSNIFMGERKIVSQFGEFLPSHAFSQQKFKLFGTSTGGESKGIGSAIIIPTDYQMKGKSRGIAENEKGVKTRDNVDGFFMPDRNNKNHIFIVEGIGIDKKGRFISLDWINNPDIIKTDAKDMAYNKDIYKKALEIHNDVLSNYEKGDAFHDMQAKIYQYNNDNSTNIAVGALNSRQPRNQAGDIVINRLKTYHESDNTIITSHGKKEGNLSSQNFVDVIHAQDADFDMDKSMVFGASHRKFWGEAGRLAGYESTADAHLISNIFTDYVNRANDIGMGFDWGPDTHKSAMNSVDAARGRFVKMHQTMSYMANIFRSSSDPTGSTPIMTFTVPEGQYKNVTYEVRVNPFNANYINTTEAIGSSVKKFVDMYKNAPDAFNDRINELQYNLYFGEANGQPSLFQVGTVKKGKFEVVDGFNVVDKIGIKETITENFLRPINKYLTYNKGIAMDEASMPRTATLEDFHGAFRNLSFATNSKYVKSRYNEGNSNINNVNLVKGLNQMNIYFGADGQPAVSRNPYDVAMREIYKIKTSSSSPNELVGNERAMIRYIEEGFNFEGQKSQDQMVNEISKRAFIEIVKDDAKVIEYKELASLISSLDWQMNQRTMRGDPKGAIKESAEFKGLQEKRDRAISQKQVIEDALAYKLDPTSDFIEIRKKRDYKILKGEYTNNGKRPIVVRDGFDKTTIKEVIAVGRRNYKPIDPEDTMVFNGKRYELVEGEKHLAMEVSDNLFNTSNGWVHRNSSGKEIYLDPSETAWLRAEVSSYNNSVKDAWNNKIDNTRQSINEYSMKRLDLLNTLFSQERIQSNPAYQEAIVAIMMTPGIDRNVVTIAPYSSNMGGGAKLGVKFYENKNSKVIFQYLSQLSNSSIKNAPMSNTTADAILKDFITMKKLGMYSKINGVDVNLDIRRSMAKEHDLLTGHIQRDNQIGIDVFNQLRQGDNNAKKAASVLIDYSNGERMVDSSTMYKASKVLERAGIPVDRQFINTKYLPSQDRLVGIEKRYYQTIDRNKKQNLGENNNINQGVSNMIKKSLSCFKGGD